MTTSSSSSPYPGSAPGSAPGGLSGGVDALLSRQQQRRDIARLGAYAQHARHDPRETTRGAFEARMRRYEQQVDPTGELKRRDPQALARRVQAALNEEMARVRLARSKRAAEKRDAIERLRRTPPDKPARLDAAATAIAANIVETALISDELTTLEDAHDALDAPLKLGRPRSADKTKAASVSAEAASTPKSQRRNTRLVISSDGGAHTIAQTTPHRQTSTPKEAKKATSQGLGKKAVKQDDHYSHNS